MQERVTPTERRPGRRSSKSKLESESLGACSSAVARVTIGELIHAEVAGAARRARGWGGLCVRAASSSHPREPLRGEPRHPARVVLKVGLSVTVELPRPLSRHLPRHVPRHLPRHVPRHMGMTRRGRRHTLVRRSPELLGVLGHGSLLGLR